MEASPFLLVALLTLYMIPTALAAIKCYHCSDFPGHEKSNPCKSEHAESISCDAELFDRCATLTGTIPLPDNEDSNKKEEEEEDGHDHGDEPAANEVKYKNCTSSLGCNQSSSSNSSLINMCNQNSSAGTVTGCKVECCEDDFCNAAVHISGLVACFIPVFMAMFQNLFPIA